MNIDDMKIGDIKKIAATLLCSAPSEANAPSKSSLASSMVGQYVIVRSQNEGVNAGTVEMADESGVVLKDARRLWHHKPADKKLSWYEGVAETGLSSDSCVSGTVSKKVIVEDYSMTACTTVAQQSIEAAVPNAQS